MYASKLFSVLFLGIMLSCGGNNDEDLQTPPDDSGDQQDISILVYTRTQGFRHNSIANGVKMLRELGSAGGFTVTHTEDPAVFSPANLTSYKLIIFLNTTGNVLGPGGQQALEQYVSGGGAFMGVHAAADTEHDWPWYGELVGARFVSHPAPQEARILIEDGDHPSTDHLGSQWRHFDEYYNFDEWRADNQILLQLDEASYEGESQGNDHPISWFRNSSQGKVFYTGLGHTKEAYESPDFRQHVLGGILWCLDRQ